MNGFNGKDLKQKADRRISTYHPRRLVLIHTGVSQFAALLVAAVLYILQQKIATTGGLSGIGLRSALATAQIVLVIVFAVLLPFWRVGIFYGVNQVARENTAGADDLLAGFYHFGPVLRLKLLQMLICLILIVPCATLGVSLLSATPMFAEFEAAWRPIMEQAMQGQEIALDGEALHSLLQVSRPAIFASLMVYIPLIVYLSYRVRMAKYLILDDRETRGAFGVMLQSWKMTRNRMGLLIGLDAGYLWFTVLHILAFALAFGGPVLLLLHISLPIPYVGVCFLFFGLSALLQLILQGTFGVKRRVVYGVTYNELRLPNEK